MTQRRSSRPSSAGLGWPQWEAAMARSKTSDQCSMRSKFRKAASANNRRGTALTRPNRDRDGGSTARVLTAPSSALWGTEAAVRRLTSESTDMKDRALEALGVSKRYAERDALSSVDLIAHRGQLHGLLGPNGAGKTTL